MLRSSDRRETSLKQFKKLINNQLEKGRTSKVSTLRFHKPANYLPKIEHERTASEPIYDYLWPQNEDKLVPETRSQLSITSQSTSDSIEPELSSKSNSFSNISPCSHQKLQSSPLLRKKDIPSLDVHQDAPPMMQPIASFDANDRMMKSHQNLSSTPVNKHLEYTSKKYPAPNRNTSGVLIKKEEKRTESFESGECSYFRATKSRKSATIPIRESFIPPPISESIQSDRIRSTILDEMQRISTKYSTHTSQTQHPFPTKFEDWEHELRFHWKDGFFESASSDSDNSSRQTITRDSDTTSSGNTLVNDYGTTNSGSVCDVKNRDLQSPKFKYNGLAAKEYVINFDVNDARNFMEWDCDETDL